MPDETVYALHSRLLPLKDSIIPNYLYLSLFSVTRTFGSGFFDAARLMNTLLFVGAAPFIHAIARRVTSPHLALFVTGLALLTPSNAYVTFFIPEPFYFTGFWILSWALLSLEANASAWRWVGTGLLLGLLTLVKPHALFLIPGIVLYCLLRGFSHGRLPQPLAHIGLLLGPGLAIKFGLSFLLVGKKGLTWFGPLYEKIATHHTLDTYLALAYSTALSFKTHALLLTLLFGLPLAVLAERFLKRPKQDAQELQSTNIALYTLSLLGTLVGITALFTAAVVGNNPHETLDRLHLRYYSFLFPMLGILVAALLKPPKSPVASPSFRRLAISAVILLALAIGIWFELPGCPLSSIDNPELMGLAQFKPVLTAFTLAMVGCLLVWSRWERLGAALYLCGLAPLSLAIANGIVAMDQRTRLHPDVYDRAGIILRHYLPQETVPHLAMAGERLGLFRTMFYFQTRYADIGELPQVISLTPHELLHPDRIQSGREWLLAFGSEAYPPGQAPVLSMDGFALFNLSHQQEARFDTSSSWFNLIAWTEGLSAPEHWGSWTERQTIRLGLRRPLPARFRLSFEAKSFGPNTKMDSLLVVGATKRAFRLQEDPHRFDFVLAAQPGTQEIVISTPALFTPSALGLGPDTRQLGIGLISLRITPEEGQER